VASARLFFPYVSVCLLFFLSCLTFTTWVQPAGFFAVLLRSSSGIVCSFSRSRPLFRFPVQACPPPGGGGLCTPPPRRQRFAAAFSLFGVFSGTPGRFCFPPSRPCGLGHTSVNALRYAYRRPPQCFQQTPGVTLIPPRSPPFVSVFFPEPLPSVWLVCCYASLPPAGTPSLLDPSNFLCRCHLSLLAPYRSQKGYRFFVRSLRSFFFENLFFGLCDCDTLSPSVLSGVMSYMIFSFFVPSIDFFQVVLTFLLALLQLLQDTRTICQIPFFMIPVPCFFFVCSSPFCPLPQADVYWYYPPHVWVPKNWGPLGNFFLPIFVGEFG